MCTHTGLGSFPFARRYSGNRCFFLFLRVLRCFSSPGSLHTPMDSVHDDRSSSCRVPPFRHPRLNGYLLLPAAFRSLSRPSSALSAKASALRSFCLTFCCYSVNSLAFFPLDDHLSSMSSYLARYLSKCTIKYRSVWKACFPKRLWIGWYMRRRRD